MKYYFVDVIWFGFDIYKFIVGVFDFHRVGRILRLGLISFRWLVFIGFSFDFLGELLVMEGSYGKLNDCF